MSSDAQCLRNTHLKSTVLPDVILSLKGFQISLLEHLAVLYLNMGSWRTCLEYGVGPIPAAWQQLRRAVSDRGIPCQNLKLYSLAYTSAKLPPSWFSSKHCHIQLQAGFSFLAFRTFYLFIISSQLAHMHHFWLSFHLSRNSQH